jgi:hypothetical protein
MRVAITVTAILDLPDEVEKKDFMGEDGTLVPHFIIKDRKFQPYINFDLIEDDDETESWDEEAEEELDEIYDLFDDSLDAEQYTIIELDVAEDSD